MMKKIILILIFFIFCDLVYAEKIKVVYTADSYSSLYPCGVCPASVGGGVTRRATVIKEIKEQDKNLILIEGGNFTSSSKSNLSINAKLDKKRTLFYIDALNLIGYDVSAIGEEEFNFGIDFFKEVLKRAKFKFISSNLHLKNISPYYIKKFPNIRVGILALTPLNVNKKIEVNIEEYSLSLKRTLKELKGKADFIILILPLEDKDIYNILDEFKDIKLVLATLNTMGEASYEKRNDTLIIRPSYLARDLVILDLDVKDNKILNFNYTKKRISKDIKEDLETLKAIPVCFSDSDCESKPDLIARCKNPSEINSICAYYIAKKYNAIVLTDKNCASCSTELTENILKDKIIGISFDFLDYREDRAKAIIEKYKINTLPFFLLPKDIRYEKNFENISNFLEEVEDGFYVKEELAGIFMFLNRKRIENKLDFFLDFYNKKSKDIFKELLNFVRENNINFDVYFVMPSINNVEAIKEEIKLALAIKKMYPEKFLDYINLRLDKIENIYWVDILEDLDIDYKKIKKFAKSKKIALLLEKNTRFIKKLNILSGDIILVNNNRIFRIFNFDYDDLKKVFN